MGEMRIATSPRSLGRELYRYGETALADRALALGPDEVEAIGRRMGDPGFRDQAHRAWPDGPPNAVYLLAVVTYFEGTPRPCARATRLPESALPEHLRAPEADPWAAAPETVPETVPEAAAGAATPEPPAGLAERLRSALRRHR